MKFRDYVNEFSFFKKKKRNQPELRSPSNDEYNKIQKAMKKIGKRAESIGVSDARNKAFVEDINGVEWVVDLKTGKAYNKLEKNIENIKKLYKDKHKLDVKVKKVGEYDWEITPTASSKEDFYKKMKKRKIINTFE